MRLALLLALLVGCGGHELGQVDDVIGAACTSDRDCDTRCYLDGNDQLPGGFCSVPCASDQDCPADSVCIDRGGGLCMFSCPQFNCNSLGSQWTCHDRDRVGGGKANVCSG